MSRTRTLLAAAAVAAGLVVAPVAAAQAGSTTVVSSCKITYAGMNLTVLEEVTVTAPTSSTRRVTALRIYTNYSGGAYYDFTIGGRTTRLTAHTSGKWYAITGTIHNGSPGQTFTITARYSTPGPDLTCPVQTGRI